MSSRITTASLSLISFLLVYVILWKMTPTQWSGFQTVTNLAEKPGFLWVKRLQARVKFTTTKSVTTPNVTANSERNTNTVVKKAPEHLVTSLQLGNSTTVTSTTPRPLVLVKKNFKKLPEWDFEDVYMRNREEKRPVCSKSLQHSKDKKFQEKAIWDLQLWLHKGHLNMNEWNQLVHFNNPFGFMEYQYTDIKPAVDLIPKPKSSRLLPVLEGSSDGCIRCAVVGTGGILNGSKMGKEIDSHDYVFRVNGAVIKGYEEDVGGKTSVYVHTSFSVTQAMIVLRQYGFKSIPNDKGIKYVLIPEGLRDFEWLEALFQKERVTHGFYQGHRPQTLYRQQVSSENFYVLHPDFLRYVRNRFLKSKTLQNSYWHVYRPTNGAFTIFLALHTCDIVNAYGFITEDYKNYSNYYYERATRTEIIFFMNHDYNLEIETWKKLNDLGIIRLYQGQKTQTSTS